MNVTTNKGLTKASAIIVCGVALFALVVILRAQSPAKDPTPLSFEVASIKAFKPGGPPTGLTGCHGADSKYPAGMQLAPPPLGRCVLRAATVKSLITFQSGLQNGQIIGGPSWAGSDMFEIEAKAPEGSIPSEEQLKQMLLTLLAERFKLQFHRETKEVAGYVLQVAKGGPKFKEATGKETPAGLLRMGGGRMVGQNIPMSTWANYLWGRLNAPVLDKTDLKGNYTFTLMLTGPNGDNELRTPEMLPADSSGVSIFTALSEQLGLRLDSQKVSVDFFVIDAAEKPAENQHR